MYKKNILLTILLFSITVDVVFAQCGGETYSIINRCPDQQPQVEITSPAYSPDINYTWFDLIPKSPGPGNDTLNLGTGYGIVYPAPLGPGGETFYYQKEVSSTGGPTALPGPLNTSAMGSVPSLSDPYSMTVTSTVDWKLNNITLAIHTYSCNSSDVFRLQVQVGANFSQWYYFKCSDMIATSNSSIKLVNVPVMLSATQQGLTAPAGTSTVRIYSSIGGTATKSIDAFEWFNQSSFAATYTPSPGITINYGASASTISGQANKVPGLFDWDITTLCPAQSVTVTPNATGCCVSANVTAPDLSSSSGSNIVNNDPISPAITLSTPLQSGFYYQWFKDGIPMGAPGVGTNVNSISVTTAGKYTVRVAENATFINRVSCIKEDLMWVQKRILFAQANKNSICLGESVNLLAQGATGPVSWSPTVTLESPLTVTPVFTPTVPGTYSLSVTGEVPVGNQIINGDFEAENVQVNPSAYYTYRDPSLATNTTPAYAMGYPSREALSIGVGNYTINNYVFWPGFQAWLPIADHTTGSGKFLYTDAAAPGSGIPGQNKYLWSQDVVVQPNTDYEFSAWVTNFNAEGDTNFVAPAGVTGITVAPASNPLPEIMLYINDVAVFASPPVLKSQVGLWQKISVIWNSGSTSGTVKLKLSEIINTTATAGHDFGLDDISFGAPGTQTDDITITVTDCYDLTATASACSGDSVVLTATTNGIFQQWENITSGSPTSVGIGNPFSSITKAKSETGVSTQFRATAKYIFGNQLVNNDFSQGGLAGFNTTYTNGTSNGASGFNEGQYSINVLPTSISTTYYTDVPDHTTGTSAPNYYIGDSRYEATRNIAYRASVSVTNGTEYGFSCWVANIHKEFLKAIPDTSNAAPYPSGAKISRFALYINNQFVSLIQTPADTDWHNYSASWIANTTGTVNVELRSVNMGYPGNPKSGFALDDVQFGTIYTSTKNVDVNSTSCVLPVVFTDFSIGISGNIVKLNWSTAEEVNSGWYVIERSSDGQYFTEIGKVNAAGNSSFLQEYSYLDINPGPGVWYYRIKEVDADGAVYYTSIKSINAEERIIKIYPNPSNGGFHICVSSSKDEEFTYSLKTITGIIITKEKFMTNKQVLIGEELLSGVYILELLLMEGSEVYKLIKQ